MLNIKPRSDTVIPVCYENYDYDDEGYVKGVYYVNPNDFSQHSGTADGEHIGLLYMEIVCLEDGGTYTESSVPGSYMPIQRIEVCTIGQDA